MPLTATLTPSSARVTSRALATELDRSHPGAAASLRESLAETFTISRLGVAPTLARALCSTNAIESMIEICRDHSTNVKRWRDGQMALRWCVAGMLKAKKRFRRVNGHLHLKALRAAQGSRRGGCHTGSLRCRQGGGHIAKKPVAVTEIPRRSGHPLPITWSL